MKNFIFYLAYFIGVVLVQFFIGKYINIFSIFPNFIIIAVVYLGMTRGKMEAQTLGFLFGLTWDIFATDVFGGRAVMLTLVGYFTGALKKSFDIDQTTTQIFVVFVASCLYWTGFNLVSYHFIENTDKFSLFSISLRGFFGFAFTLAITPMMFTILKKVFYLIEDRQF